MLDGVGQLSNLLVGRAGYASVAAAVAAHTVFLHPQTVAQTGGQPLFPIIRMRNVSERGSIVEHAGARVLLDDNTAPTDGFLWSAKLARSSVRETQFNHVWAASRDASVYTALWNLCATPAFLAKTTDGGNHPEVIAAIRYRVWKEFGTTPDGAVPPEPAGYADLRWAEPPAPVPDLERVLRARLGRTPKSRTTTACRKIGWLFSGWEPDRTV